MPFNLHLGLSQLPAPHLQEGCMGPSMDFGRRRSRHFGERPLNILSAVDQPLRVPCLSALLLTPLLAAPFCLCLPWGNRNR